MTTSDYAGTTGRSVASEDSSSGAKEQAQQAAGTAADEGKHLASVAQEEVRNVAGEARSQLRGLVDQATQEVDGQTRQQKSRLVDTMNTFSDDLHRMASEQSGLAADVAREVAQRARSLSAHLDQREPRDLLDEVRAYARRKPGTFLLGALAAGVVAGRLTRAGKAARDASSGSAGGVGVTSGTSLPSGDRAALAGGPFTSAAPEELPTGTTGTASDEPFAGTTPFVAAGEPAVRTDTDPSETWTDPSQPGGRL